MAVTKISGPTARANPLYTDKIPLAAVGSTTAYNVSVQALSGGRTYNIKSYGALGDGSTDDRAAIQAAIDAAYAAGGGDVYFPPSDAEYMLTYAGTNPYIAGHRYALEIKSNVNLTIPKGAALKLKASQMTGTTNGVDLIVGQDVSNVYIGGGGRLTGNAAGQSGWTGGYAQTSHGIGIYLEGTSAGGCSDITIDSLTIDGVYSNAIFTQGDVVDRNKRFILRDLYIHSVGEGPVIVAVDGLLVEGVTIDDAADVMAGDMLEPAACTNVRIIGCHFTNNGAGSGIDLYGSHKATVQGCTFDQCYEGIGIQPATAYSRTTIEDITVAGCNFYDLGHYGIGMVEGGCIRVTIQGNNFYGCTQAGIGVPSDNTKIPGPIAIQGNTIQGCLYGILANAAVAGLTIAGNNIIGNVNDGITYFYHQGAASAGDTKNLIITGNNICDNGRYGLYLYDLASGSSYEPAGLISGNSIINNVSGNIQTGNDDCKNIMFERNNPKNRAAWYFATDRAAGYDILDNGYDSSISTILGPGYRQTIIIYFEVQGTVIDKTESGGNNISLAGATNLTALAGNYLCLQYDGTDWVEMWRKA